jgi:hypothetical protein
VKSLWPFRREAARPGAAVLDAPSLAAVAAPEPGGITFRSWGLSDLLRRRMADRPWRVLDLGSVNNANFHFFTERGVYAVEELHATLAPCRAAGSLDVGCIGRLPNLLVFSPGTRFDAIFAWDLLDHIGPAAAGVVGQRLADYCHPRTLLHTVVTREPKLPAQPARWEVVDDKTMLHRPSPLPAVKPSARFNDTTLQRALGAFRVHKSYLLQLGFQEYLLEPAG